MIWSRPATFLASAQDVRQLVVGVSDGNPVYLRRRRPRRRRTADQPARYVWLGTGPGAKSKGIERRASFPP